MTSFSDDISLTTTRTRSAFMFPRPFGSFIQSFPGNSIEQLWDAHSRGESFVTSQLSIPITERRLSCLDELNRDIVRQLKHVTSLPLWPIRGIYWFLLKR